MSSTRSKGTAFEVWCQKKLEAVGFAVHRVGRKTKMIGKGRLITVGNDIFGCDLVAIKAGRKVQFFQCTEDSGIGRKLAELKKYPWELRYADVYVWVKRRGGVVVLFGFTGEELFEVQRYIRGKLFRPENGTEGGLI